jgi:hypothetical protein
MRHPLRLVRGTLVQLVGGPLHGERRVDDATAELEFLTLPVDRPLTTISQALLVPPPPSPPDVAVYARTADGIYRHVEGKL